MLPALAHGPRLARRSRGGGAGLKLIEFANVKCGILWVNAAQVLWVAAPEGASASMYGDNNVRAVTRLHFGQGAHVEVRETLADVVARLND
jgi:hypothetical protein